MGAHSSHHEPLDRNTRASSFRRSSSLRHSKIKGNRTPPRAMDKLRRSIRSSFRRRKDHISEASKPHIFQSDDMDVRSGTCYFHVKYLGCIEVYESRGMQVCEEALRVLKNSRRRPIRAILHVSGDGLRVVEDETKGLIVDQTIEKVSFCAPDRTHERGFSYICRDGTTRRWMCHSFLAVQDSGERLSHAVGCAFAVCLERKQKRDKECSVTMKFDLTNSTFTRTGSFRPSTMTEKLQQQDTANKSNWTAAGSKDSDGPSTTTTVINISNNINTNYDRKENISVRPTPRIKTHAIERPHATISMLQRQGSYRGLSHLNHASPFKRQLSLRLSDLPSNADRTRSHSLELSFDSRTSNPSRFLIKTPVVPIPELSTPENGDDTTNGGGDNSCGLGDQVSAMCQQLSQGLSLLSNNEDLFESKTEKQTEDKPASSITSTKLFELQPLTNTTHQSCSFSNQISTADHPSINDANKLFERSNQNMLPLETNLDSEVGIISSPKISQLPVVDQWVNQTTDLNSINGVVKVCYSPSTTPSPRPIPVSSPSVESDVQSNSLSEKEKVFDSENKENTLDPFNIDWASLAADSQMKNSKSTNPFLTNKPMKGSSDTPIKMFEVQM